MNKQGSGFFVNPRDSSANISQDASFNETSSANSTSRIRKSPMKLM